MRALPDGPMIAPGGGPAQVAARGFPGNSRRFQGLTARFRAAARQRRRRVEAVVIPRVDIFPDH